MLTKIREFCPFVFPYVGHYFHDLALQVSLVVRLRVSSLELIGLRLDSSS